MKATFLCQGHYEQLSRQPKLALKSWNKTFAAGRTLCEQENFEEGIPFIGCAFEAAQIMLQQQSMDRTAIYDLFTSTATMFGSLLRQVNLLADSLEVSVLAIQLLEEELHKQPEHKAWLEMHLDALRKHLDYIYQTPVNAAIKAPSCGRVTIH